MSSTVWFGTENQMRWVAAPQPGVGRGLATANAAKQLLNGGAWRRASATGSRQLQLVWPTMTGAEVRKITAFLEGTYGPGPFYYVDPFAESANLLPQWLAVPYLAADGGPKLANVAVTGVTTPANTYLHPTYGASYAVNGAGYSFKFPVPPNETANFGWKGSVTGSAVLKVNGTTVAPTAVTTAALTNFTYTAPSTGGWVTVQVSGVGTLIAYSMHLNLGSAATGEFVKGEGYSGLAKDGDPTITGYSAGGLDRQAVSANFVEVGPWL